MKIKFVCLALAPLVAGCGTIEQKVQPVTFASGDPRAICVVDNPAVTNDFAQIYTQALAKRGLTVRVIPQGSAVNACPLTTTYTGQWNWDLALYLSLADLKVYRNGLLQGEALYNSKDAKLDTGKFIVAKSKIEELTAQLFPG